MSEPGSIKDRHKIIGAKVTSSLLQVRPCVPPTISWRGMADQIIVMRL